MSVYRHLIAILGTSQRLWPRCRATALALVSSLVGPAMCGAQADPQFNAEFDLADQRAQRLAWTVECYSQFGLLIERGAIASIRSKASVGAATACFVAGKRRAVANFTLHPDATRFTQFVAVDLGTGDAVTAPLDTMRLRAEGIALASAIARNATMPDSIGREYLPFSMRTTADSIEVWMLRSRMFQGPGLSVGGELGYVFSPDGRVLVREIGSTSTYRTIEVERGRPLVITSLEARMPAASELLLANMIAARGAQVTVQTSTRLSTLLAGGTAWVHVKR